MDLDTLKRELIRDEGLRLKPYRDSVGKLTIGVGRNLDDIGISEAEASVLLSSDIDREWQALRRHCPWVDQLDEVRSRVLANMSFNLGVDPPGCLLTFVSFLGQVQSGRYEEAAAGMLSTLWARQVGQRATRLAAMMRTGLTPTT